MKNILRSGVPLLFLALLLSINIVSIVSNANADVAKKIYMAGNWVTDSQGNIIGCSCPVMMGVCICEIAPNPVP